MLCNEFLSIGDYPIQGILTEGERLLEWLTSLYQLVQINGILYWNIFFPFYRTSYLNEEVNCTETSPSVRVPCPISRLNNSYGWFIHTLWGFLNYTYTYSDLHLHPETHQILIQEQCDVENAVQNRPCQCNLKVGGFFWFESDLDVGRIEFRLEEKTEKCHSRVSTHS